MKIHDSFRIGLLGGLGVIVALALGGIVTSLATILTYIGAALFLALGFDPLVRFLERHAVKRPIAILVVVVGILAVFAGLIVALVPVIVDQVSKLVAQVPIVISNVTDESFIRGVKRNFPSAYKNPATA